MALPKLSAVDKVNIVSMVDQGYPQWRVAKRYKVSRTTVSLLCKAARPK